jgi:hypothetical protein
MNSDNIMHDKETTVPTPKCAWLVYQVLAWFFTVSILLWFCCVVILGQRYYYFAPFLHMQYVEYAILVTFLFFCLAAITRRRYAAACVMTTGLWYAAIIWTKITTLFEQTIEEIRFSPPTYVGYEAPNSQFPMYFYFLTRFGYLLLCLLCITAAFMVAKRKGSAPLIRLNRIKVKWLLRSGIAMLLLAFALKVADISIQSHPYAMIAGSYFTAGACGLILLWHLFVGTDTGFYVSAAIGISAVILMYQPLILPTISTIGLWSPAIGLGIIGAFCKKSAIGLRTLGLVLPVLFMLLAVFPSVGGYVFASRWVFYQKPTSERPVYFPGILAHPPLAENMNYSGSPSEGIYGLNFTVKDPYPSEATHRFINEYLTNNGWQRLNYDLLNPNIPCSMKHLWPFFGERGKATYTLPEQQKAEIPLVRSEDWLNKDNSHISVLYNNSGKTGDITDQVFVNMSFYNKDSWMRNYVLQYKKLHPEEFELLDKEVTDKE